MFKQNSIYENYSTKDIYRTDYLKADRSSETRNCTEDPVCDKTDLDLTANKGAKESQ